MNSNGGFGFKGVGAAGGETRLDPHRQTWDDGLPEDRSDNGFVPEQGSGLGRLPLGEDDRLPWLESPDDVDFDDEGVDSGRLIGFILIAVVALALMIGAIWWLTRAGGASGDADGSLIEASKEPYKVRPQDAGGKVFEGTGDLSYEVSEGVRPQGSVAADAAPAPVAPLPSPSASASAAPAKTAAPSAPASEAATPVAAGTGVQIGAFSTRAAAEAAWVRYQSQHEALQGTSHRVVEGRADIGTVYRLQAVAGSAAAARSMCSTLQAGGLKCQVK